MRRLLAVPNFSEGRNAETIHALAAALDARLLDIHSDPDHNRSVFTLHAEPGQLAHAVFAGARAAVAHIDLNTHIGVHPRIGALDVAPIVYLDGDERGAACAEALVLADMIGHELRIPVFLYGELGGGRSRAQLRRSDLRRLPPDFGPSQPHPTAGATLVAARPPLVAFNLELAPPATVQDAKRIAAAIREDPAGKSGLQGVRAIGLWLQTRQRAQVSTNVEDHRATPLAEVLAAVRRHAAVQETELVGLAPRSAFEGFPEDVPVRNKRLIEDLLA